MSLELINTIATLSTTAVIAATAVAALVQLRHLRASNQIAGFLTLRTILDDDAHQRALALLEREGDISKDADFLAFSKAAFAGQAAAGSQRTREIRAAVVLIANSFEVMGTLVRNGIVDRRLFLEQYSATTVNMWRRLAPYIAVLREVQSDDAIWEDFEYITALSRDYLAVQPTIYPKGMARLLPSYERKSGEPRV